MAGYTWKPIEPIADRDRAINRGVMQPLYEAWRASKARLQQTSASSFNDFNARLIRRLSVETGILERIYDLDRGTTEALVAHGFAEDLVSHSGDGIEPSRLIDVLRDHEAAIQVVMDGIAGQRDVTRGLVHEIHAVLTRHQDTTVAVDQFGKRFEIPLLKGKFKEQPNNPTRPDGYIHEYCPPVHVASEMDNLLAFLSGYADEDPIIVAAWLHHRFTQIHPYQDGNGRVARTLTALVLIRAELLPLVIDRDLRTEYIDALESADSGDLSSLALLFVRLERAAILQALSIDVDTEITQQRSLTAAVIENFARKINKRQENRVAELNVVNGLAREIREQAWKLIDDHLTDFKKRVSFAVRAAVQVDRGGSDLASGHWYKFEVVKSAKDGDRYANFNEPHYFVKASVRVKRERLLFVTSFHHVGRDLSGIMEATAFCKLESFEESDERQRVSDDFILCSLEPFIFTFKTNISDTEESFRDWLDQSLAIAMKEFGDRW